MFKEKAQGIIRLPATFLGETESIDVALRWKDVCLSTGYLPSCDLSVLPALYRARMLGDTAEWLVQKWMLDFRAAASRAFSPCSARAPALPGCAWLLAIPCTSVVVVLPAKKPCLAVPAWESVLLLGLFLGVG